MHGMNIKHFSSFKYQTAVYNLVFAEFHQLKVMQVDLQNSVSLGRG
jgi:hypothetical protein